MFRRTDVAKVRITYPDPSATPVTFEVAHVDLYFFYDIDMVILTMEVYADDLPLTRAGHPLPFRPRGIRPIGSRRAGEATARSASSGFRSDGKVLAVSDYEKQEKYLSFVCRYRVAVHRVPLGVAARPLVLHHSGKKGLIRYRQIEFTLCR